MTWKSIGNRISILFLFFGLLRPVTAQPVSYSSAKLDSLRKKMEMIFSQKLFKESSVGFYAKSLKSGQVLHQYNETKLLSTASCMKLVTTAAALDKWGTNRQFRTGFYTDGKLENGILKGNLFVKGFGDPYLVTEKLLKFIYHLKAAGWTSITGDIIADDSFLSDSPNAETNDRAYSAIGGALGFNFNTVTVFVRPGKKSGDSAQVFVEPISNLFTIVNNAKTGDSNSTTIDNYKVSIQFNKTSMTISVYGVIGIDEKELEIYKRVDDPTRYTATVIQETLKQFGISVQGKIRNGRVPMDAVPLYDLSSYDLSYIISGVNKWSNNYVAGQLLMIMGAEEFGEPGNDEKGIRAIKPFISKVGISDNEIIMVDGSGLDARNKMTASAIVRLLEYMYNSQWSSEYMSSLSIAGVDGTERKRFKKNGGPAEASRLKIGYLWGVSTLSGFIESKNGDRIAFAILTNDFPKEYYESVKQLEDQACKILYEL